MDKDLPANFDPQQVSLFLDKIERDRDNELDEIARQRDAEMTHILGDARRESRRVFRQSAAQLRTRLALEQSRDLARLRADLRRRQWEILVAQQQNLLEAVSNRLLGAWQDPDRQWQWCRFWLDAALERAGNHPLEITLGQGASNDLQARLDTAVRGHAAGAAIRFDTSAEPGIRIEWGDYVMDGRLASQIASISDAVLTRLSGLVDEEDGGATR